MATFNRFDIAEAHYVFAMLWHEGQGSKLYRKFAQLERLKFKAPSLGGLDSLSENGREIYDALLHRHRLLGGAIDDTHVPKAGQS